MAYYLGLDQSYSSTLRLLDNLCDKLDESGIEGNVIERDSWGRHFVHIWYGSFNDPRRLFSEMFTVLVTDSPSMMTSRGCFEIKPPKKYYDYFYDTFRACASRRGGFYVMSSDEIVRTIKFLFNREKMEKKKENNMKEFTLETKLFGKLKANGIYYKFDNGVYNTKEIVITTKMNYNICKVKSKESSAYAYEVCWFGVPADILVDLKIDRITLYNWSDDLIEDILKIEKKLISSVRLNLNAYAYTKADVLATEALYNYRKYGIVDVIFNDPATIVIWSDGSKTVVKANGEKFDPEKGLAMAISKKVLGNKHNYYDIFKKYVGRYEKKQKKAVKNEKR